MKLTNFCTEPFSPVLPTVFSDDLSYYEFVAKVGHELKRLVKDVNFRFADVHSRIQKINQNLSDFYVEFKKHEDTIFQRNKDYTDSRFNVLKNLVDGNYNELINKLYNWQQSDLQLINANFQTLVNLISEDYDAIQEDLVALDKKLKQYQTYAKQYAEGLQQESERKVNERLIEFKAILDDYEIKLNAYSDKLEIFKGDWTAYKFEVEDYVEKAIGDAMTRLTEHVAQLNGDLILITSPVTGKIVTLPVALSQVYSGLWWAKISAKEYDDLHLNASQYDSRKITALDYDTHARFIFFNELYMLNWWLALQKYQEQFLQAIQEINEKLTMRNPITGRITDMKQVIYDVIDKLHNEFKLTANEYDHLKVAAGTYDALMLTAFEYDFYAKKHLGQNFVSVRP